MVNGTAERLDGSTYDVVVVGGGPAGLAAAIVAAEQDASVLVLEQRAFPPDKACGEGLLPPAVRALERLGVLAEIPPSEQRPFAGIRFVQEDGAIAALPLPGGGGFGLGVRRTVLVEAMARRASRLGVVIADRTSVRAVDRSATGAVVHTTFGDVRARLVVAADGLHSPLRREARLNVRPGPRRRFAVRQHFAIQPWTDCVEVHVDRLGEAVVTPVSEHAINVNFVWEPGDMEPPTIETLCRRFPALQARLAGAPTTSTVRGAGPMDRGASRRTCRRMILIGDAGGFIDSIAADGLSVAFNSALVLGENLPGILARDATVASLAAYERAARRLFRNYQFVTNSLLWIARHPSIRHRLIRFLSRHHAVGDAMMSGAMRLMLASVPA
jgi:flavin-dependent dehydrogenase